VDAGNKRYRSADGVLFNRSGTALLVYPAGKTASSYSIPAGVQSIGEGAFSGCKNLTAITVPSSVTLIGPAAFYGCAALSAITVDAMNLYYSNAGGVLFDRNRKTLVYCPAGKTGSYAIPHGVTAIEEGAFSGCTNLTAVTIPNSVKLIGEYAFLGCTSLLSIAIPTGILAVKARVFYGCSSLTAVTIPIGVISIGYEAFSGCTSLSAITIPNSVTVVDKFAFSGCTSLSDAFYEAISKRFGNEVFERG
jgi:hypothetical protein